MFFLADKNDCLDEELAPKCRPGTCTDGANTYNCTCPSGVADDPNIAGEDCNLGKHYYSLQRSCGKVMFSQASVILFTWGGMTDTRPGETPPWADTPTLGRYPRANTPPGKQRPGQNLPWTDRKFISQNMH